MHKEKTIKSFNGSQPSKACVDGLCGRLLDIPYYNSDLMEHADWIMKYLCDHEINHGIRFDIKKKVYISIVKIKLKEPVKLVATANKTSVALSLCGAQLALLANI